jgi:hypothetical protein
MDLETFLSPYDEHIRSIVMKARALLLEMIPGAIETQDGGDIGYGYDRGYTGLICVITPYQRYVNLGLFDGARLADPQGLLEGRGRRHRHVKIHDEAELDNPALHELIREAVRRKGMRAG